MIRGKIFMLFLLACVASFSLRPLIAIQPPVAFIEEINGTVYLREPGQAERFTLDPEVDLGRRLHPGETLECGNGGTVILRMAGMRIPLAEGAGPFVLKAVKLMADDPKQKLLDAYVRVGGRDKDVRLPGLEVYTPAPDGFVIPEKAVIRWNSPSSTRCTLSLFVRSSQKTLWKVDDVNRSTGVASFETFRLALNSYRRLGRIEQLTLDVRDSCGGNVIVKFRVLSERAEKGLRGELESWESERPPFVQHLGLASVYDSAGLYSEAADEYEEALRAAPKSRDLLIRAISALHRTGNDTRADDLEKRLPRR